MSLPNINATFSKSLNAPKNGYSGKMSQPYWVPIGTGGRGCFVIADESVLYVLNREQDLILQLDARLSFSGFAVDGKTIYIVDGHVLFRYDLEILQTKFLALPKLELSGVEPAPQRAYNLVTDQRYSAGPSEGDLKTIYDLVNAADKANAEKLAEARCLRSWRRLIQDAQKERRKSQSRLLAKKGGETNSDTYDLLANRDLQIGGMIDDARWLLGVDSLNKDRSCQILFAQIEEKVRKIEGDAVRLRFSPPVLRKNREVDGRAVYVMDATGLVIGLTASLSDAQGTKNDPPIALEMSIEENIDRSAGISYLTSQGVTLLKVEDTAITKIRTTPTTATPASWIEALALKRSQSPWSKASLGETEFMVHNVSTPTSKDFLFVSNDEGSDAAALQLVSSPSVFPAVDGSNDFIGPVPGLYGGILFDQKLDVSCPIVAPVYFHLEDGINFVYALAYSSFSPTNLLKYIDNIDKPASKWTEFVGKDAAARTKTRESVKSGKIPTPRETYRPLVWNKIKLQTEIKSEDWQATWKDAKDLLTPLDKHNAKIADLADLRAKSAQYFIDLVGQKNEATRVYYREWCQLCIDNNIVGLEGRCRNFSYIFTTSADTTWKVGVNARDLANAEKNRAAIVKAETDARNRASTAYSQSSLWNAWKQVGPQLLKLN